MIGLEELDFKTKTLFLFFRFPQSEGPLLIKDDLINKNLRPS